MFSYQLSLVTSGYVLVQNKEFYSNKKHKNL